MYFIPEMQGFTQVKNIILYNLSITKACYKIMDQFLQTQLPAVQELISSSISLSRERNLNRLLNKIVRSARRLCHADAGSIYILDGTKTQLHLEVFQSETATISISALPPVSLFIEKQPNMANICCYCAFSGKVINIPDAYQYSGFNFTELYERDLKTGYHSKSVLAAPLRNHEDTTIGVLELVNAVNPFSGDITSFPQDVENLVSAFASHAAVAIDNVQLIEKNRRLIEILDNTNRSLEQENQNLRNRLKKRDRFSLIIGKSPGMGRVFDLMEKVLNSDVTVLITGETGSGKELIAKAIHHNGHRRNGDFVAINCASLPENLLESELFGYVKGAFTGANTDKKGLLEVAGNGTLFMDEIGDMPLHLQAKLLRVLQEGEMRPLGSSRSIKVTPRIIAATHRDLKNMTESGDFREDLYYRLYVFPIELPPLKERKEDIPLLLHHFLKKYSDRYQKNITEFSPSSLQALLEYDYPGNIRELKNIVERMVLLADDKSPVLPELIPDYVRDKVASKPTPCFSTSLAGSIKVMVNEFEASIIRENLQLLNWNQTRVAQKLGIPRRTLIDKMNRFDIKRPIA